MVLLDAVESWNAKEIVCITTSHRRADHPLRRDGFLPACAAIEYAAQAMAVHGALTANGHARQGVLGSVRRFRVHCDGLDRISDALRVYASLRHGAPDCAVYAFSLRAGDREIASGEAAVFYSKARERAVRDGGR